MLAIFSSNGEAQHLDRRPTVPIGFTIIPAPSEHASYRSYRAAIVDPRAPSPSLQLIRVNDTSFTKDQGTEFVSWIEGGKRALILRVDFPDGICMTDQNDSTCGGDPIHDDFRIAHMRLDVCVVKGSSLVGCPSVKFRKDRNIPTNVYFGPYFYNWAPQAFYDYRGELSEFVFQTHAVSPAYVPKPGEQSDVEMWRMDIDGSRSAKIVEANANAHGCQISPNQQLMVCERRRQGGIGDTDFVLTRSDGSERRFLGADEREPSLLMRWSPDSRFLVYFTEKGGKQSGRFCKPQDTRQRFGTSILLHPPRRALWAARRPGRRWQRLSGVFTPAARAATPEILGVGRQEATGDAPEESAGDTKVQASSSRHTDGWWGYQGDSMPRCHRLPHFFTRRRCHSILVYSFLG